jgi:hypothetical protein
MHASSSPISPPSIERRAVFKSCACRGSTAPPVTIRGWERGRSGPSATISVANACFFKSVPENGLTATGHFANCSELGC